jgi:hypothetical protein
MAVSMVNVYIKTVKIATLFIKRKHVEDSLKHTTSSMFIYKYLCLMILYGTNDHLNKNMCFPSFSTEQNMIKNRRIH